MLTYLMNVTGDMLAASIIIGLIFAFADTFCGPAGRRNVRIGLIAGLAAALVRAYITNTRRLAGGWRVGTYGYGISLALFVVFIVLFIVFSRAFFKEAADEDGLKKKRLAEWVISILSGLLIVSYLYCSLPNVYAYPFKFDTGGEGFLSTAFLFRLGGYLLGIIVCLLAAVAAYRITTVAAKKGMRKPLTAVFILGICIYAVNAFASLMLVLTPRKIIDSITLFRFSAFLNNHSQWYAYILFAALIIISAMIWIRSYTAKEPYSTNAERRRQRAIFRTGKRYSVLLVICFVCAILCSTLFVTLNTEVIREAPVEEFVVVRDGTGSDSELRIPLEMVEDGHLHRFGYTTQDGYQTRVIVILKQENTTNYGVGLDACEICGEAGYYENSDGNVVCRRCGVVMNTSTIGLNGGCNPIVIDYDITDSYITIPVSELVTNQTRFSM